MRTLAYVSADNLSTEIQRCEIAQLHNVEHWFADEALSESVSVLEQPGFMDALKFARRGDILIVHSIQSLGKCSLELFDALKALKALRAKGANVISVQEGFDLSSPQAKAFLKTAGGLAQLKRIISGGQNSTAKRANH